MKFFCLFALLLLTSAALGAQALPDYDKLIPEDYDPAEFPQWVRDVGRYESLLIGSFPVTFLFSSLVYDIALFAANGGQSEYKLGTQRGENDISIIIGSAAIVSVLVATADLIINLGKRNRAEEDK